MGTGSSIIKASDVKTKNQDSKKKSTNNYNYIGKKDTKTKTQNIFKFNNKNKTSFV